MKGKKKIKVENIKNHIQIPALLDQLAILKTELEMLDIMNIKLVNLKIIIIFFINF